MNMRKKVMRLPVLCPGALHILQWGMVPIFVCLSGIFCSANSGTALNIAEIRHLGGALQVVLASLLLLTAGVLIADLAAREQRGTRF